MTWVSELSYLNRGQDVNRPRLDSTYDYAFDHVNEFWIWKLFFLKWQCNCSISTVIYVQHLTKLPLCTFSNYIAFYFKIASFCHLTRPSLQFRMANWLVLLWSQWGKSLLHLTLNFYAFSVCNLILILQFHYEAIMYCLINCKWIIMYFCHFMNLCIYLQNYKFDWKQSFLLISQTPCHLAAVTWYSI